MMEESVVAAVPPPLPPKTRLRGLASARGGAPTPVVAPVAATGLPGAGGGGAGGGGSALSSISTSGEHVVKIRISPEDGLGGTTTATSGGVRISVGGDEDMVRRSPGDPVYLKQPDRNSNPYFFCSSFQSSAMVISSGQSSPSDTLDSGTCSDLDGSTPPPLPKKTGSLAAAAAAAAAAATVTVTVNGGHAGSLGNHRRTGSLTSSGAEADSDEDAGSNISCDSLNSHELNGATNGHDIGDDGFMKSPLSNGIGKLHVHNHHDAMESIEEERAVAPPPPPPLKSVALTVRANDFVNNIANGIKNLPSPVVVPEESPVAVTTFAASPKPPPPKTPAKPIKGLPSPNGHKTFLPQGLLQDIRDRTATLTGPSGQKKLRTWGSPEVKTVDAPRSPEVKEYQKQASTLYRLHAAAEEASNGPKAGLVQERTYEERVREQTAAATPPGPRPRAGSYKYEEDRYYQFHLRERDPEPEAAAEVAAKAARAEAADSDEETFAGLRDVLGSKEASATIRSAKGTVRGVRNRVRAGIATFLHYPDTKNYKEKEAGKVVLYVTTMGIVRHTFQECLKVKKILRTLLVKYEERDAFMSREVQTELRERMHSDDVDVPQLFVEGQYIGGAETIERLNETGELRKMLKPFKSPDVCHECQVCGGFRLLPCSVCNGSKKSMHCNDFTAEFVALKCMHCDEVGLVKCHAC